MTEPAPSTPSIKKALKTLASPAILFYALPWLMILLSVGTIAQKELGLYRAQELFFSGWIVWLGPLPLPGAYATLGLITLCLLAKFLLYSPWRKEQAGTILTHLGVLILLIGGILTAATQKEGFMAIGEGQSASAVSDYHARVVTVEKDGDIIGTIDFALLTKGKNLNAYVQLPFDAIILFNCSNCRPDAQPRSDGHGLAAKVSLTAIAEEKEPEANLSGLMIAAKKTEDAQDGTYLMMEEIPHKPSIAASGHEYRFSIGRKQMPLPFSITLEDFQRTLHPGTDMAKGFSSAVTVQDGDIAWPYTIRMNEPLRYKGYTFYQSSFSIRPDGEQTILSVVQNKGRTLPYLASAIIFAGILWHLVLRLAQRKRPA